MKFESVTIQSSVARAALLALAVLWSIAGWWIVVDGSMSLSLDRRSTLPVLLDGGSSVFMALVFLFLSTTAAAAVFQAMSVARSWYAVLLLLNLGLPVAYRLIV